MAKYLSLDWFKSKINKAVDKTVEKVVNEKVEKLTDQRLVELQELDVEEQIIEENLEQLVTEGISEYPISSYKDKLSVISVAYLINGTLTVILKNSTILNKEDARNEDFETVMSFKSEEEIIKFMSSPERIKEIETIQEQKKEVELITSNFDILVETGDFEVKNDSVYLKGINRSLPKLLVKRFAEVVQKQLDNGVDAFCKEADIDESLEVEYQALKKFWMKCCLNPNAQSAEDLYEFLENHNMKIDKHGNFYTYRRVVSLNEDSKELVEFISNAYNKVKAVWKKSVGNFEVYSRLGDLKLVDLSKGNIPTEDNPYWTCLGNLKDLYLDLPNMKENRYTDKHTHSYDYRVGQIHSMPRDEGDDDNTVSCSKGFHQSSKAYDYSGFGDQDILCIVNPISVLAVPKGEVGKLRVSDWFFAMTLEEDERHILDEDSFNVQELGDIFEEKIMEDLEQHVKKGFAEEVKRHTYSIPQISSIEIKNIINSLDKIKTTISSRVSEIN